MEVCGASRGNPGLSGVGVVIRDPKGKNVEQLSHFLGIATSIRATYEAVLKGLERGIRWTSTSAGLTVLLDDETVWRQVTGRSHALLPEVAPILSKITDLLHGPLKIEFMLVEPARIERAERLANVAVDSRGRRQTID